MKVTLPFETISALIALAQKHSPELAEKASSEVEPATESQPTTNPERKKGKSRTRFGASGGPVMKAFHELWSEGQINATVATLRERTRKLGRYYASDNSLVADLKKSKRLYKEHEDGTWSLVNPPKPKAVA